MSLRAKRELLLQIRARYHDAGRQQRTGMLDEFIAATGYNRKYAVCLLAKPVALAHGPIKRQRERIDGPAIQEALLLTWSTANFICAKRLIPFLPDLVASLECSLWRPIRARVS